MNRSLVYIFRVAFLFGFFTCIWGQDNNNATVKFPVANELAHTTLIHFVTMFEECVKTTMPAQHFLLDNVAAYLFYPAKTTVGYAPHFTGNRKLFANLIATTAFHKMLQKDMQELRKDFLAKLKFCDEVVMDQEMLKDMYDRKQQEDFLRLK